MTPDLEELLGKALGWKPGIRSPERASRVLAALGGARGLVVADVAALVAAGVSPSQAERLRAAIALAGHVEVTGRAITSAADVVDLVGPELRVAIEERLIVLCLDRRHRVTAKVTVTTGSGAFTIVDPAQIYRVALVHRAQAILLVHNHPSGDPTPSAQDHEVTRRVASAGRVVGIPLLDHVVVATGGYASLAELGTIPSSPLAQAPWAA